MNSGKVTTARSLRPANQKICFHSLIVVMSPRRDTVRQRFKRLCPIGKTTVSTSAAGRDGFVDLRPPFLPNAVGADGIACGRHRRVTLAKLLWADALLLAAAHDRHGKEQRQPLNLPLGADLLHNADGGVD